MKKTKKTDEVNSGYVYLTLIVIIIFFIGYSIGYGRGIDKLIEQGLFPQTEPGPEIVYSENKVDLSLSEFQKICEECLYPPSNYDGGGVALNDPCVLRLHYEIAFGLVCDEPNEYICNMGIMINISNDGIERLFIY